MSLAPGWAQRPVHSAKASRTALANRSLQAALSMTVPRFTKSDPMSRRLKVQVTPEQEEAIVGKADSIGLSTAAYIRAVVLADLEGTKKGPHKASQSKHASLLQVAELHALTMYVKKLHATTEQLARQAGLGNVPITRAEILYLQAENKRVLGGLLTHLEKLLS